MASINYIVELEVIKLVVSDYFNRDYKDLNIKSRKRHIVEPRQIYHYFAKKLTKNTLTAIGYPLDHATVLNSIIKVQNKIDTEKDFKSNIDEIQILLNDYNLEQLKRDSKLTNTKSKIIKKIMKSDNEYEIAENIYDINNMLLINTLNVNYEKIRV